ncbi:MAG TPA: stage II sporulation protein M [Anaerolineae bacterium]|nr:stage II sporulation protein M [Anaerolineae bacterium]
MSELILDAPTSVRTRAFAAPSDSSNILRDALVITRREVRDSLRDWRIVLPILILTLIFPWLMNFTTRVAIDFVEQYSATIIPIRLIPFGLMIVGFFPITFSLVIALETFVGEKERNSLEPLLGAPLSDASLYLGKLMAATALPLFASYIGITAYLSWLYATIRYVPDWVVLTQILLLTTMEAFVMVTGAVVVSAHTTSVRAANLLASFIIIPMAFLLQAESVLLFWGDYDVLWYIIAALVVVDLIFVRMGIQTFNREEILAREVDEFNPRKTLGRLVEQFRHNGTLSLRWLLLDDLPQVLHANRLPIAVTTAVLLAAFVVGWWYASQFPLPPQFLQPLHVQANFTANAAATNLNFLPSLNPPSIFLQNARTLILSALLSIISFGIAALMVLILPVGLVGFIAGEIGQTGTNPALFLGAFILPHGIFELPAVVLATAFGLRIGASVISGNRRSGSEGFIGAVADWIKVFCLLVVPLLLIAAFVEANITPRIVAYFFGG